jgi:hypothetical protein
MKIADYHTGYRSYQGLVASDFSFYRTINLNQVFGDASFHGLTGRYLPQPSWTEYPVLWQSFAPRNAARGFVVSQGHSSHHGIVWRGMSHSISVYKAHRVPSPSLLSSPVAQLSLFPLRSLAHPGIARNFHFLSHLFILPFPSLSK